MGIRDYLSSTAETLSGGLSSSRSILSGSSAAAAPYLSGAWQSTRGLARVASESAVWTRDAVAANLPDRQGWARVGRLGWRIADHAIDHGTKTYTCGIPVYRIVKEELRKDNTPPPPPPEERRHLKEKKEDEKVAVLRARVERIERENVELQRLKIKMESVEMRLMQIQRETEEKKKKEQKRREDWDPPELIHLI